MTPRLTRRSFLAVVGVAVAGGAAAAARVLTGGDEWSGPARTVAKLFDDPDAAVRLGEIWLVRNPHEDDPEVLVRLLAEDMPGVQRALSSDDVATVRKLSQRRVTHELGEGHFHTIEGWLVASTEARLAALLAAS